MPSDNASKEAEKLGKTPDLCKPNSTFQDQYIRCRDCIQQAASDPRAVARAYIEPIFGPLTSYCASSPSPSPSATASKSSKTTQSPTISTSKRISSTISSFIPTGPSSAESEVSTPTGAIRAGASTTATFTSPPLGKMSVKFGTFHIIDTNRR
ncbi:hypothetical protein QBC35DRAFT_489026 [Podospora australis]|uniref:Uncharacterized protein n=1 Tax=Podospora australis TaxID=1536484 RepID=A0AAN6X3M5_9PEZI|nr:hypothetical protein QBC35DRAFT_489026 [Podospora australis]